MIAGPGQYLTSTTHAQLHVSYYLAGLATGPWVTPAGAGGSPVRLDIDGSVREPGLNVIPDIYPFGLCRPWEGYPGRRISGVTAHLPAGRGSSEGEHGGLLRD